MAIKAVIFDFFGVLHTDTLWGLANVYIPDRSQEQVQQLADLAQAANLGHVDRDTFWKTASEIYGKDLQTVLAARDEMGAIDQGLLNVCDRLRSEDIVTAIISNVGTGFIAKALSAERMRMYFDLVVESGAVGMLKPDPRIFEYACSELGLEPNECIFFDDVERNVEGARAVGMQAEHYTGLPECVSALRERALIV